MQPIVAEVGFPPFAPPAIPLVDGTGRLWPAGDTATLGALRQYTIREQVLTPYHFGRSVEAAIEATSRPLTQRSSCSSGQGAH